MASKAGSKATCPTNLRILGKPYEIIFADEDIGDNVGRCVDDKQRILVAKNLGAEAEKDTVLHEVMHAIDHYTHLKMSERQISVMATCLLGLLADNPELTEYLWPKKA